MSQAHDLVDRALRSVEDLRRQIVRGSSRLVRSQDELALVKAMSLAWFNNTRPELEGWDVVDALKPVDEAFEGVLRLIDKDALRATYVTQLKGLKERLAEVRPLVVRANLKARRLEPAPSFVVLVQDGRMQAILTRRWEETIACLLSSANLAATVMMGGVLEGLLLARLNLMPNQAPAFKANAAPKDRQGKTLPLKDWTLHNYIGVAHELGWIRTPAKDIGVVLRDWRNFIHPAKELTAGVSVNADDAQMFWTVFVQLSKQVLLSANTP